jgi:hypothetical protein
MYVFGGETIEFAFGDRGIEAKSEFISLEGFIDVIPCSEVGLFSHGVFVGESVLFFLISYSAVFIFHVWSPFENIVYVLVDFHVWFFGDWFAHFV